MNVTPLSRLLSDNIDWYAARGRRHKLLSLASRGVVWLFATSGIVSMSVGGASVITVLFAVAAASAFALDRTFALTRNWLEFSFTEVALRAALTRIEFLAASGATRDEVLTVFDTAVKAIEAETLGWKGDISSAIEELKSTASKALRKE